MEAISEVLKTLPVRLVSGFETMTDEERERYRADLDNKTPGDLGDGVDCPDCLNRGYSMEVRHDEKFNRYYSVAVPCQCRKVRAANRRLRKSGLADVVKTKTFDSYETPEEWHKSVKERAVRFCETEGDPWFFMGGQSGAGKTHLCTAIAGRLLEKGKAVRYMLWRDDIAKINAVVNEAEQYGAMMGDLKNAPVLYIDDLFKTGKDDRGNPKQPTAAEINRAFEIINYRYNNPGLITVISSERTLSELLDIDEAIAGRIAEKSKEGGFCINLQKSPERNWRMRGLGVI